MEEMKVAMAAPETEAVRLDASYVIAKIDQIMSDSEYLKQSLALLAGPHVGNNGSTAIGISKMIEARERTNQEMISLLKRVVNKL